MIAQRPIERFNSENLKPLAIWIFVASLLKYGSRRTLLTSENRRSDFNEHNQRNRRATKHKRRNVVEGQTHHVISSVRPTMTRCRGSDPPRHFKGHADPQSRANTSLSRHVGPCSPVLDVHTAPNGTSSALNLQAAQSLQRDRATPYGSRNRVNCCT